jgi:GDP/UDP-N,N'-diacetylbacillosamine 2-epimerase (hydrolysing)
MGSSEITPRHICVWSGKRGGFGALLPTMKAIAAQPNCRLSVVATDQHLYSQFGRTIEEVASHVPVSAEIDMEQAGDSNCDRARAVGVCLTKAADVLARLAPDILLVIGDRGEVFAACIAAHNLRIAIAHVQGGDISGSLDEPVRHAITKLAHLHFPSTPASAKRLLNMGEEPWRIHTVGDTHIDQIFLNKYSAEEGLRERYNLPRDEPLLLVLQHSDSTCPEDSSRQMSATLEGVLAMGIRTLLVYPCSDQGFEGIISQMESHQGHAGVSIHKNIPAADFIGLQRIASCLIGNSSAGLIEAPYFQLPVVNVGDRQTGRERCANVMDCPYDAGVIREAIHQAIYDSEFKKLIAAENPPFGDGTAYKQITGVLATVDLDERLLNKRMTF